MPVPEQWTLGLHRTIRIAVGEGECRGILHDDFHHFRVTVRHADGVVRSVEAQTLRGPYSLCARVGAELAGLVGAPLSRTMDAAAEGLSARLQCTHQFDLATLAIAAAGRNADCRYDAGVRVEGPELFRGSVCRDGVELFGWQVAESTITDPPPFAGRALGVGFAQWARTAHDPDAAEAALVLRRAFVLARARRHIPRLDSLPSALPTGNCWVQQPGTAETAARLHGVVRDYSAGAVPIDCADLDWLAQLRAG